MPAGSTTSTCGVVSKSKSDRYQSRQLSISSGVIDWAMWSIRVERRRRRRAGRLELDLPDPSEVGAASVK